MTKSNNFTKKQENAIYEVGKDVERARLALRLSIRQAAERTHTDRGHLTEFTWRRVERGFVSVAVRGISEKVTYRPTAQTIAAICEVVGLDVEETCQKLGLEAPPPRRRDSGESELSLIREEMLRLATRLDQILGSDRLESGPVHE